MIEDFVWHSEIEGRCTPEWEQEWIKLVYQHKVKQTTFAQDMEMVPFAQRFVKDIYTGRMETQKQDAAYVGLSRVKGRLDLHGRIHSPFRITRKKAEHQITLVSDTLILYTAGVPKGFFSTGIWEIEELLSNDLLCALENGWTIMKPRARRKLDKIKELPDSCED